MIRSELSPENQRELGKLIVSIRANSQRLDLLIAICDDPDLRETLIRRYESVLQPEGIATYRTRLNTKEPSLKATLAELVRYTPALNGGERAVVTVLGGSELFGVRLSEEKSEQEKFFFSLQWTREALREFEFPVVIWLSNPVATALSQQAKDFWGWRSGVFEFEAQPQMPNYVPPEFPPSNPSPGKSSEDVETALETSERLKHLKQFIAEITQQNPKSPLLITLYSDLGDVYQKQSAHELALQAYEQALEHANDKDKPRQAGILLKIGETLQSCRRYGKAQHFFELALRCFQDGGDRTGEANADYRLGAVAYDQRHFEEARSHYQQALDIFIEYNDRYSQAITYHQLGNVSYLLQEYEQARSFYQQALDIKIEFGDRYSQALTYHQLGTVAQELREYEQARSHYQQSLDIKIEFGDRYNQAGTYHQLGTVAQELGEYEQARSHYQQALDIFIEFGDRYSQASTYGQLGVLAEAQEDYGKARQYLQQALEIFVEFNDQQSVEIALQSLAQIYQTTQDDRILTDMAQCLDKTVEELRVLLERVKDD